MLSLSQLWMYLVKQFGVSFYTLNKQLTTNLRSIVVGKNYVKNKSKIFIKDHPNLLFMYEMVRVQDVQTKGQN